jgi:signal transduction histidine kinase
LFRGPDCNNDGVWNETVAALGVVIQPAWWQTWWFRSLAGAGAVGAVVLTLEARLRRLRRERAAQQSFSRRLLESQEEERKRIAAELHDSLGQDLLVIKNRALLGLQDPAVSPPAADQLGEISRLASHTLEEVRGISRNLRPYQLDHFGLTKALESMVLAVARGSGIPITAELDPLEGLLPPTLEIQLFRIVQELLNNVVKHSQAATARVAVRRGALRITLAVEDDGRGFDPDALEHSPTWLGLGLTDVTERVRLLGGTARCDSRPTAGTRWTIEIPAPTNKVA